MKRHRVGDIVVISPRGYLTGGEETEELQTVLQDLLEDSDTKSVVLNFRETLHLNNTALGVLISAHSAYTRKHKPLVMCHVDPRIQNIFVITKLDLVFSIKGAQPEALEECSLVLERITRR